MSSLEVNIHVPTAEESGFYNMTNKVSRDYSF